MVEAQAQPQIEIIHLEQNCPIIRIRSDQIRSDQPSKQASDFITVNDYLVRYIKMNYEMGRDIGRALEEMGRDIGRALEDLSTFNFTAVKPTLSISFETDTVKKKAEDRQYDGIAGK